MVNTPAHVDVNLNNLLGKSATGIQIPLSSSATVNGTQNFWGCAKGPGAKGCSTASGAAHRFDAVLQPEILNLADHLNSGALADR